MTLQIGTRRHTGGLRSRLVSVRAGRVRPHLGWCRFALILIAVLAPSRACPAEGAPAAGSAAAAAPPPLEQILERLQRLEQQNAELGRTNQALSAELQTVRGQYEELNRKLEQIQPDSGPTPPELPAVPNGVIPEPMPPEITAANLPRTFLDAEPITNPPPRSRFLVGDYDPVRGQFVVVRPIDESLYPFELRIDMFTQARYTNFAPSSKFWVDSTGATRPVRSVNSVEINRNLLNFSGFAFDPRLQYNAIVFSSTSINDTVYLGWMNYRFNDAFDLRVGNWLVPGTREWYESFRFTLGSERLMATTFFRPNISPGVWAQGEPFENFYYVAMIADSLNRFGQGAERVGDAATFGGTVWWEPAGPFGRGPSDIENHDRWTPRLGFSMALSRERNQAIAQGGLGNPEDTILRLSDGTPVFRPDSLGPGVSLSATSVRLWTVDAALKYRGFSVGGEYFFRWLGDFDAVGGPPKRSSTFDHGALVQGSYFFLPRRLEAFGRSSFVTGPYGGGSEFGGGLNWYVQGTREWRFTFEVLHVNRSPAENILTGYRAGASGTLFQLQWFTDF